MDEYDYRLIDKEQLESAEVELLANTLYSVYCEAVGGAAFNGDPLPTWAEFKADAHKTKQVEGWRAVARMVHRQIGGYEQAR